MVTINIKALTLWQPYASLIRDYRKHVETRKWSTKYRGILGIHAGMKVDKQACQQFSNERFEYDPRTIERGAVLCTVMLVDCVQFPNLLVRPDPYGDFTPGRYGWIMNDLKCFWEPVPAKGGLSLWNFELKDEYYQ